MGHSIKKSTRIERELTPSFDNDRPKNVWAAIQSNEIFKLFL